VPGGEQLRPYRAMVDARAIGTLAEGLGSRFHQTLSPRGAAQTRGWRWAALGCAALDVAKAYKLTRDDHFNLPARLLLDSADLALWCAAARDDTDTSEDSVIPGVALAAEAGARLGVGGLIVPALNAAVAAAVRHRRGHRLRLEQFSWQLMGVTGGWMIRALAGRRRRTFERRHAFELHARLQEAELAGLHEVVVEHEGALDLLQRATALIDLASNSPVRRNMAGSFKAGVAQAARARATYLRDALLVWQSEHNLQPDLTRMVRFDVFPEHGTILLTEVQRSSLYAELEVLDLAGPVPVSVVDVFEARRPGGARDLLVAGQLLALPSEAKAKSWTFDAIPVAMLMEVGWLIQPTGAHREEVPWSSTAVPLAIAGAATAWATRRVDRQGRTPPRMANAAAFVTASSYTLLATRTMRHTHTEAGISRFPWVMALQGYELVRTIASDDLSRNERRIAGFGTAAIIALGWALSPPPRSGRALVAELGWVLALDVFAKRLQRGFVDEADEVARVVQSDDARQIADAYEQGRHRANATIGRALAAARQTLRTQAEGIAPDIVGEAERRLSEVQALLPIG